MVVIFEAPVINIPRFMEPELLPPIPLKVIAPGPVVIMDAPILISIPCFCPLELSPPRPVSRMSPPWVVKSSEILMP